MDDLKLLKDVDTNDKPSAAKNTKKKVDKDALKGDLSAFAQSLGLSTTISDLVDMPEKEKGKKEKKKAKEDKVEKKTDNVEKKADKTEKKTKKKNEDQITEKKEDKPEKTKKKQKDTPAAADIPGFKVKSAKDAAPLKKAKSGRLTVQPNSQWFSITLPDLGDGDIEKPNEEQVLQKFAFAEQLLETENGVYEKSGAVQRSLSTRDRSFVSNILSSGTLSDRVSALTLIVQESPVHSIRALGQLISMVQKKNRREALLAVGSVKDLMMLNLLPSNRKLKYFADQPIMARGVTDAHWILWAFEDKLKRHYFDLIQVMESMAYDPVLHTRQNMVTYFEELLESKPEQEQNLLRLLVNKLGDKERQLAAKASYLILKLLNAHPNMKYVVVKTVQELLLTKSSTKERAQYYTMITLNQIILSSKDVPSANLLLEVYFVFFHKLLKITNDNDEAAAKEDDATNASLDDNKPDKNTVGKKGDPKKRVYIGQKALKKAKEEAEKKKTEEERAMDNKLLAAILTGLNRALPFSQMEDEVMDKHIGVIFQVAHAGNFNTVVQSLVLLGQVVRIRPNIGDRFYRTLYDSLLDPRLDGTSKKAMYLNVLFRALKADINIDRVKAFIKRIMQVCLHSQAEFVSGALFLVSQIISLHPEELASMLTQAEKPVSDKDQYDSLKRDPKFANADKSCLWEAALLAHHYHPSVTHSIQQIFDGEQVPVINNLHNHSLAHFLDRFVFRKPKGDQRQPEDEEFNLAGESAAGKGPALRGQSLMQPYISQDGRNMEVGQNGARIAGGDFLIASKRVGGVFGGVDLTFENLTSMKESDVPPEERFFHQFFQTKKARMGKKTSKKTAAAKKRSEEGQGGAGDDMDEDEVWQAMSASMPKVAGDDELGDGDVDVDDEDDDEDLLEALNEGVSDEEEQGASEDEDEDDDDEDDDDGFPNFDDEISESELAQDSDDSSETAGTKRKDNGDEDEGEDDGEKSKNKKRKKSEKLPLFGSFDDYAHLIDSKEGLE